jgi:hypothetical protein
MDFQRAVSQVWHFGQPSPELDCIQQRICSDHGQSAGPGSPAYAPDVQIGDLGRIAPGIDQFDRLSDLGDHRVVHLAVEQDTGAIS